MAQTKNSKKKKSNSNQASIKKNSRKEPAGKAARIESNTGYIAWGILFLILSICIFVSYFLKDGIFIIAFSNIVKGIFGYGYWAIGICFLMIFFILCFGERRKATLRTVFAIMFPMFFSAVLHLISYGSDTTLDIAKYFESGMKINSGGVLGSLIAYVANKLLGQVGGSIIIFVILIIMLLVILGANADTFKIEQKTKAEKVPEFNAATVRNVSKKIINDSELQPVTASRNKKAQSPVKSGKDYNIPILDDNDDLLINRTPKNKNTKANKKTVPITIADKSADFNNEVNKELNKPARMNKQELKAETLNINNEILSNEQNASGTYVFPTTDLLSYGKDKGSDSKSEILSTKERLENTLHSFGINSYVVNITPGPTVTRYDIELEQGVKLSKVTNLAGDIALSLGVLNVRVAPILDEQSTVGIEVPNKIVNTVSLREIIESKNFTTATSKLTFAIGKDIGGNAIIGNISKLPHMLIAGTTGSGKSVCMNSLIISLLYKARPDEVKFIMIDPKMVELGVYNAIPHLYVPVVTDPKKAAGALQWVVVEMLKRYKLFSEASVRDLESYNKYLKSNKEQLMPQIVIVIDELADLMMAASKEVEECICRVAQMGRAAGIHLIIATQRPSADVITGLMKANIPSRIAFAVSSAMESRIIMDTSGAEKLVGMGDMLYSPLGSGKPLRVQGSFVSDADREKVIKFISTNCDIAHTNNKDLEDAMNKASNPDAENKKEENNISSEYDEKLSEAVDIVLSMKSCSVSMLQRRLKLGYSRAARVVDQMEELGIVGPSVGAKPREILVDAAKWHELQVQLGLIDNDEYFPLDSIIDEYQGEYDELS